MEQVEEKKKRRSKRASPIEERLQALCDLRDQTVPGSPEEEQAALNLLDCILNGGR